MAEMTIREAAGVLSGVCQQLRAAKLLEAALKNVMAIDGMVSSQQDKKNELDEQIIKQHVKLAEIAEEIEAEQERKKIDLNNCAASLEAAQAKGRETRGQIERELILARKEAAERVEELTAYHLAKQKDFEDETQLKKEELTSIEGKLQHAKEDLAQMKERLG